MSSSNSSSLPSSTAIISPTTVFDSASTPTPTPTLSSTESLSASASLSAAASSTMSASSSDSSPPDSASDSATSISSNPPSSSSTSSATSSTTSTTTSISTTSTSSTASTTSSPATSSDTNTRSLVSDHTSSTGVTPTDPPETLHSTVFVTTTDSFGHTTTSAPSAITSIITLTTNGILVTTTEVKLNPTLSSNGQNSGGSSFFKNTGAVAGVFVLVGLAAAAIVLWVLFGLRRRRRNRRMEHDTAVSATLAAAGFHRAPLDDDEHQGNDSRHSRAFASPDMEMRTGSALALGTSSSIPSAARTSGYQDSPGHDGAGEGFFNPYNEYDAAGPVEGYIPARTSSPPPTAFVEPYRDTSRTNHAIHHSGSQSLGSTEPLLASFNRAEPVSPAPSGALQPPTPPPRNPKRVSDRRSEISPGPPSSPPPENRRQSTASSVYSSESTGDERLNPALRNSDIRDSEDYSRRVLGVRNIPDGVSQVSRES